MVTNNIYGNRDLLSSSNTTLRTTSLLNLSYTRDLLGGVTSENSTTYGYDGAERLTSSSLGPSPLGYDLASQLTSASSTTYAYDNAGELSTGTVSSNVTKYVYNPEGERTSTTPPTGPASTYTWNQAEELSSFTQGSNTVTYAYNGNGLRMSKTGAAGKYPYVWDVAEGLPLMLANIFTDYVTGPDGLPLEQITGSTVTYFTHDQLGSTRLLTNASGASVGTYTYTPYGTVASHTGSVSTNLGFAGQFTDNESGLEYLRARYYDPATGQFLSVDPSILATSSPYAYGNNSPLNFGDRSGAKECSTVYGPTTAGRCQGTLSTDNSQLVNIQQAYVSTDPYSNGGITPGCKDIGAGIESCPYMIQEVDQNGSTVQGTQQSLTLLCPIGLQIGTTGASSECESAPDSLGGGSWQVIGPRGRIVTSTGCHVGAVNPSPDWTIERLNQIGAGADSGVNQAADAVGTYIDIARTFLESGI